MTKEPVSQPSNDQTGSNQTSRDQTGSNSRFEAGCASPESLHRLAGLLIEVSNELDQVSAHLHHEEPAGETPDPEARTPDPPPHQSDRLAGGEPVDTSFAPPQTPVAAATGVSRFHGAAPGESRRGDQAGAPWAVRGGLPRTPLGEPRWWMARWPGWFAGAAAMCGATLLLVTAATRPGLLSPAQVVGGFALGAGLLGIWASRSLDQQ